MADEILARSVLAMGFDGSETSVGIADLKSEVAGAERDIAAKTGKMVSHLAGVSDGAARGADGINRATKQAEASLQRMVAAFQAGEKGSASYYENLFKGRGADVNQLRPLLDQLQQAQDAAKALAADMQLASFDKLLAESVKTGAIEKNIRQLEAALVGMGAAERELSEANLFEQRSREAAKLTQAAGYVQFWTRALDDLDAQEKALSDTAAFDKKLSDAAKLRSAGEYVQFWTQELDKMEAAERDAADAVSFENQRREAIKLQKSAEYVQFWTDALQAKDAQEKKNAGNDAFLSSLQRQASAIGKTRVDLLEMEAAEKGLTAQAAPMIAALRAQEKAIYGLSHATRDGRVSANQLKAAYAQLPAQITDVFTSLAGGQNPLLVLIQQGGQVKDSFGGVGNTFRALGSGFVDLVSKIKPLYLALGGIGTLLSIVGLGYKKGAEETDEFVRAIVLTGNAAGVTVGQLQMMSREVAAAGGTQGKAAEVLTRFASSAKVGAAELVKISQAAIGLERVGGPAVEKTAEQFEALARSPAQAAAELNKQTNFLTAALYEQIKALEDQGRAVEAAALAQSTYADVLAARKVELEANMGSIERGWRAIKDAILGAVDALANIGRANTIEQQIQAGREALERLPSGAKDPLGIYEKQRKVIQDQLDLLNEAAVREAARADFARGKNEAEQAGIRIAQLRDSMLDREAKKNKEIAAIKADAAASRKPGGTRPLSDKDEADLIAAVNKKYEEKQKKGEDLHKTYGSLIAASSEHVSAMAQEVIGADKLTQGEKRLLDMQSKIEAGTLTYNQALYAQAAAQFQAEDAAEKAARIKESVFKLSEKLAAQEERANEALAKSIPTLAEQVEKLKLGEEAYNARSIAQMRDEAAGLVWQAQMEGGNDALEYRAELLRQTADLSEARVVAGFQRALDDEAAGLSEVNQYLALEASLIGQSRDARAAAIAQLQIELKMKRDIARIRASTPQGPAQDDLIAQAVAQANDAIKGIASQQNIDRLSDLLDPDRAEAFGAALTDAFEGASDSFKRFTSTLSDLIGTFAEYGEQQKALDKGFAANRDQEGRVKDLQVETRLLEEQGEVRTRSYAAAAGAAKGFFAEGSKGYLALQAVEAAFTIASIASSFARSTAAATEAVLTQGKGDPYTAFARMAAMAAAVASLGFAVGGLVSGKSSGGVTAADRQGGAATGRIVTRDQLDRDSASFRGGTVFGDDEARSESIAKSIDILADVARLELPIARSQLNALEAIRDAMAGLSNLVVRTAGGGLTTGKNFGVQTGLLSKNEGDPILKAFGVNDSGVIQGLANSGSILGKIGVFAQSLWGKVTQKIADSGLEVSGTIADLLVRQFADIEKTTSSFFGLSKKTSTETIFGDEKDVQTLADQFSLIFQSIGDTIKISAEVLGREGGEALAAAVASFPVAIERLSLKDLNGDELQEAISAAIGAQADTIAQSLVPGLEAFQTVGEGYFETLIKVSSGIEFANYQLDLLGITAIDYTAIIRKQGDVSAEIVRQSIAGAETVGGVLSNVGEIVNTLSGTAEDLTDTYRALVDVRSALIKVGESGETLTVAMIRGAGGLDNLAGSLDTYFTEFFTEQEQLSANADALAAEFGKLGLAVPLSRDEFRSLITALNDGTDAGAALAAKVLGLAGAFDEVADAAEEAASRLTDSISEAIGRFGTPQERRDASFGAISTSLQRDAGVSISIEQLIGASITDIDAFARSFLVLGGASDDAKTAVINAALALADLKDEAAAQGRSLELDLMRAQGREYEAIAIERQAEIEQLRNLEATLGVAAGTFTKLQEELYAAADAAKILSGLDNVISDFLKGEDLARFRAQRIQTTLSGAGIGVSVEQIMGATTEDIVELWNSVGDAGKQAILDSYGSLTQLQTDLTKQQRKGLEDQLAGMKGLRDLAKDLKQFVQTLKFGDLSPLSAEAQLAEAKSLFETTFAKARDGDTDAQGNLISNAQAYLQELQAAFASGPAFSSEFARVTDMLEALGLEGEALDPQIQYLESLDTNSREMLDALLSIDSTLKGGPTTQGIGERDFISGPAGSSGGLSGSKGSDYLDVSTTRQTPDAAKQAELLQEQVNQLRVAVAELKALNNVTNAAAVSQQTAALQQQTKLDRILAPLQQSAREQQMSNAKQRAFPVTK